MPQAFKRIKPETNLLQKMRQAISRAKDPTMEIREGQIVFTGVVTFVDLVGIKQPLYSCRVDLDGTPAVKDILDQLWFEPILPIHLIRIPERFERIYVMYSNLKLESGAAGYWLGRSNERTTGPQKVVPVDGSTMEEQYDYAGVPYQRGTAAFDSMTPPTNLYSDDKEKQLMGTPISKEGSLPRYFKAVPGDVLQLGGYNTAIRQTYNINSGKGEIELISGFKALPEDQLLNSFGNEMGDAFSSKIAITTKSPTDVELNQHWGLDFHKDFNLYGPGAGTLDMAPGESLADADFTAPDVLDSFILLQTTGHIRLINNESSEPISHIVLAEPLIELLNNLIDRVREVNNNFLAHGHNHPMGPTLGPPITLLFAPIDLAGQIDSTLEGLQSPESWDAIASNYVAAN
tara:strand:+ start:445 stop:1653 length:1209 start_codon:yes stop_codon:yes gene_type:complete